MFKTTPMICFGALSWPSYPTNVGKLPAGTYTIKARGYDSGGAGITNTFTKTLIVLDCCPGASFTADYSVKDTVVCEGENVVCTNTSSGTGLSYKWLVDGEYIG